MRVLLMALALCGLAGCAEPYPSGDGLPATLPEDWASGVAMLTSSRTDYHSGAHTAILYPTDAAERPMACAAYRDDVRDPRDECEIRHEGSQVPWEALTRWAGPRGDGAFGTHVVAYDADLRPVAWWNGTDGPSMQHYTE